MDGRDNEQVCHVAETFRRMVAQAALKAWSQLPSHTRIWVSVEDLIQEGMDWLVMVGIPKWDKRRSRCMSTFVHRGINNLFFDKYARGMRALERDESRVVSFEDLMTKFDDRGRRIDLEKFYRSPRREQETMVRDCFVVPLVMRVHGQASRNLKTELTKWFLTAGKFKLTTPRFVTARNEFAGLAKREGLEIEDCRHLMNSLQCRDELSRRLRVT